MKIYITVTGEPLFINPFIKKLIKSIPSDIIGVGIVSGSLVSGKSLDKIDHGNIVVLKKFQLKGLLHASEILIPVSKFGSI